MEMAKQGFWYKVTNYFRTHKKFVAILTASIYLVLTIVIVISAVSIFNNFYFKAFYVHGGSMNPTFCGDESEADYVLTDTSYGAKKSLKRYQVVTTYYFEGDTDYKIKRVLALPGETFKIENDLVYLYDTKTETWGDALPTPFDFYQIEGHNYPVTTLKDDEYFVAGDNRGNSWDSFDLNEHVKFDYLIGVVTVCNAKCKINDGKIVQKWSVPARYFLGVDY